MLQLHTIYIEYCLHYSYKAIFVCTSMQFWLGLAAIIVLNYQYRCDDGDADGDLEMMMVIGEGIW